MIEDEEEFKKMIENNIHDCTGKWKEDGRRGWMIRVERIWEAQEGERKIRIAYIKSDRLILT